MLHGQTRYNLSSRFLDELPESCLKWISPKQGGWGTGLGRGGSGQGAASAQPAWGRSGLGGSG